MEISVERAALNMDALPFAVAFAVGHM
jgi:hypothetical protein